VDNYKAAMSNKTAPKHLYVEYMYGFLFHYTDQPLFPSQPSYTLVKVFHQDSKAWEAIYKDSQGNMLTFYFDGTIKLRKNPQL
jgi:hypothetical protein